MDNFKHNKKRNVAFVYEALTRELTKAIVKKDSERKEAVFSILREHFKTGSLLRQELDLYKILLSNSVEKEAAAKYVSEAKARFATLDKAQLFNEQTKLINKINSTLSHTLFETFIPNYKQLASIYQIFNNNTGIKEKIVLEQKIIEDMAVIPEQKKDMQNIDTLVIKSFLRKFNEKYNGTLLEEQKSLVNSFVLSFSNNGLDFKIYLNEEISRLKDCLADASKLEEVKNDKFMSDKMTEVQDFLSSFRSKKLEEMLTTKNIEAIMQIQRFVHEANKND
jgi:hypothetical protein